MCWRGLFTGFERADDSDEALPFLVLIDGEVFKVTAPCPPMVQVADEFGAMMDAPMSISAWIGMVLGIAGIAACSCAGEACLPALSGLMMVTRPCRFLSLSMGGLRSYGAMPSDGPGG